MPKYFSRYMFLFSGFTSFVSQGVYETYNQTDISSSLCLPANTAPAQTCTHLPVASTLCATIP